MSFSCGFLNLGFFVNFWICGGGGLGGRLAVTCGGVRLGCLICVDWKGGGGEQRGIIYSGCGWCGFVGFANPPLSTMLQRSVLWKTKPTADATEDRQKWPIQFGWVSMVGGAMTFNSPSEKMKSSWWDADSVWTCLTCWSMCKQLGCCLMRYVGLWQISVEGAWHRWASQVYPITFLKKIKSLFLYLTPSQWLWFALVGVSTQSLGPWKVKSQEIQKTGQQGTQLCIENTALKLQSVEISYKQMEIMIGWRSKTKL